jgi:hypothetical protein
MLLPMGSLGAKSHFLKLFNTSVNLPAIRGKNFCSPLLVSTNLAARQYRPLGRAWHQPHSRYHPAGQPRLARARQSGAIHHRTAHPPAGKIRCWSPSPLAAARHEQRHGELLDTIFGLEAELEAHQAARKKLPRHITLKELPEDQRFAQLRAGKKLFIGTIKLIAYRSETALVELAREVMKRSDDARSLIRGLIHTSANLRPDLAAGILNVELYGQANPITDTLVANICKELNSTHTTYPGTNLRLKFTPIRSLAFPAGQDV